jgi:type IV pilus assembly protein PilW
VNSSVATRNTFQKRSAAGFTIVELMVALIIALLITAAVGSLYVTSNQSSRLQDGASGIDETLRAVEADMAREIRKAGYFGCYRWKENPNYAKDQYEGNLYQRTARVPLAQNGKRPIPMDTVGVKQVVKLGPGYDIGGGAATTSSIAPLQGSVTPVLGSEFVSVSYGQPQAFLKDALLNGTDNLVLNKKISVKNGQPLVVSSCDAMTLMRSDSGGDGSTPVDVISHDPALDDNVVLKTPDGVATPEVYHKFSQGSTVMSLASSVFFLGQKDKEPPTLYLLSPDSESEPAQPLAANVEKLNLLYGVDKEDGTPLVFSSAADVEAAGDWPRVKAVKVGLVVSSAIDSVSTAGANAANAVGIDFKWSAAQGRYEPQNTATDNRLRKAHVFTVAIRGRTPSI